jgi:hypothetical protein
MVRDEIIEAREKHVRIIEFMRISLPPAIMARRFVR